MASARDLVRAPGICIAMRYIGARMTALTSGGTIPETVEYSVVLEPQAEKIGTVNEDFAVESLTGDVFQLGNASYRILRVEAGRVRVEDAKGAPPNIPFWLGEAPGLSDELSAAVSRLRGEIAARLDTAPHQAACHWRQSERAMSPKRRGNWWTIWPTRASHWARCLPSSACSWSPSSMPAAALSC